ncbi:MAG TPA: putative zinc-binding peptidase [Marinobacter sp.]|nr:putative zinc-binding peptidase [Marinobacter sp.]
MKLFYCRRCANLLYFENTRCTHCDTALGFCPEAMDLLAVDPAGNNEWLDATDGHRYRLCANYTDHHACNWLVPADEPETLCVACRLNHIIPDLQNSTHFALWCRLETEKRRLIYSLLRLGLPCEPRREGRPGLAFDFLADQPPTFSERGRVLTGHVNGLITLNIAEADPVERERMRGQMAEPYRTVLGHFRHESGHYYWDQLVRHSRWLGDCRRLFGDDTRDYNQALEQHYQSGPPADWQARYISPYAASHPWEDWAETWAHYLHIVDTLETAWRFGLRVNARHDIPLEATPTAGFDPYESTDFDALVARWLPLTLALNSLNRSMGHDHAYPFVLAEPVVEKLRLVHSIVHQSGHMGYPTL